MIVDVFFCESCRVANNWPGGIFGPSSHGPCELCKTVGPCHDIQSSRLPSRGPTPRSPGVTAGPQVVSDEHPPCNAPCGHNYDDHDERLECYKCECRLYDCSPEQGLTSMGCKTPPPESCSLCPESDFGVEKVTDKPPSVKELWANAKELPKDPYEVRLDNGTDIRIYPSKGEGPEKIRGISGPVIPDYDHEEYMQWKKDNPEGDKPIRLGDTVLPPGTHMGVDWGLKDKSKTVFRFPSGNTHTVPCGTKDCETCAGVRYIQQSQTAAEEMAKTAHILDLSQVYPQVHGEYFVLDMMRSPAGFTEVRLPRPVGPPPEVTVNGKPAGYECGSGDTVIKLKEPVPEFGTIKIRWRTTFPQHEE